MSHHFFFKNPIQTWKRQSRPYRHAQGQKLASKNNHVCKSDYFLHFCCPKATQHPRPTSPQGLSLHFSGDLHLIPFTRTMLGLTLWMTLGLWLGAEDSSSLTSLLDPLWWCSAAFVPSVSSSCLNRTTFLILKDASEPDWNTSFILVPGFFLFLRAPKQEQSFREKRVSMIWSHHIREVKQPSMLQQWKLDPK